MFSGASRGIPSFGDQSWKRPVICVADPTVIFPAATLSPASGRTPGQTLTANANGSLNATTAFSAFGSLTVGERILISIDANTDKQGIWTITSLGGVGTPWILTRATDNDTFAEYPDGSTVLALHAVFRNVSLNPTTIWSYDLAGDTWNIIPSAVWSGTFTVLDALSVGSAANPQVIIQNGVYGSNTPVGTVLPFAGSAAPTGWHLCDGTSLDRTTYSLLFGVIGTTYGAVDGTHFNLPDLRQRFPLGKAAAGTGSTLGGTGGAIDHTHTLSSHTHTSTAHQHETDYSMGASGAAGVAARFGSGANVNRTYNFTTSASSVAMPPSLVSSTTPGATGGPSNNTSGTNNPPFIVLNYIIYIGP